MKSYAVTVQMKPRQQYLHMVLFMFLYFYKIKFGIALNFYLTKDTFESKRDNVSEKLIFCFHLHSLQMYTVQCIDPLSVKLSCPKKYMYIYRSVLS